MTRLLLCLVLLAGCERGVTRTDLSDGSLLVYCEPGKELRLKTTTPRTNGDMFALLLECKPAPPLSPAELRLYGVTDGGAQ